MIEIDELTVAIGIGALLGSILHIILAILFLRKNKVSTISKSFATFFICVAIALVEISMYYLLPIDAEQMKLLYSSLYIVSMIGVMAQILGIRQLIFPTKNPFKTIMVPLIVTITAITFTLSLTDVTHLQDPKNPIYSPLFILCFIVTFDVPLYYIIYELTVKRNWISEERKKWFKKLRYFFIINSFYPILEGLSGLGPKGIRALDLGNGIFILTSLLLLYSLPNYKAWYVDELKTLTVINQIEGDFKGSIEKLWANLEIWQKEFEQQQKELSLPEFHGYLAEIEKSLKSKWD